MPTYQRGYVLMRFLFRSGAGFAMILWEMATMTKPFERMGREEFFREVVSSACFFLYF